jgi:two-component system phosphate regulon sensor histidine kinase PhoR
VPLIIITGHGTVANAVECMKKGAYEFITKPFRGDHLILVVQRALDKRALERRANELQEAQKRNLYDLATEQSRTRTIVNCMADGVMVTNRELEVVLQNPALMRLLSLDFPLPQRAVLSDFIEDHSVADGLRCILESPGGESELISRELCKGRAHLRALSAPINGPGGDVLGSVTVFHDITIFKELDQMKSNFVYTVSHELRSPLAAVKQQLSVILEGLAGDVPQKQRELLMRAETKIQNLIELINDLLDVAKIESGHTMQQQVPMELSKVLVSTVELMNAKAQQSGVNLILDLPDTLPTIQADPRSMEEVFTNLIANAVNYSPDGGKVIISATSRAGYLEVAVSDTGIGIEEEEIPKIFDKFYRVKHPRTRQVIGTGLGLAIVKGIIDSHRGYVEVESRLGVGTTFKVLLPTV